MAEKEFSREEVQGTIFYGAPQQSMAMPVEQKTTASIPVPPPLTIKNVEKGKPVPNKINAPALVETVGSANKQLQELIPKPEAPSAIHNLVEEISNNWKSLAIIEMPPIPKLVISSRISLRLESSPRCLSFHLSSRASKSDKLENLPSIPPG